MSDPSDAFDLAGNYELGWTVPGDWATTTINTVGPLYYTRARLSTFGTGFTGVQFDRVELDVTRYLPYAADRTISATGLSDIATWTKDNIAQFRNPTYTF